MKPLTGPELDHLLENQVLNLTLEPVQSISHRATTIFSLCGLLSCEVTENRIRNLISRGGLDLDDPQQFHVVSQMLSLYVKAKVLRIHDRDVLDSLVRDIETSILGDDEEEFLRNMNGIVIDGLEFRNSGDIYES